MGIAPAINVNLRLQDEAHIFGTKHIPVRDTSALPLPAPGPGCQSQLVHPALPGPFLGLEDEPSLLDKPSDCFGLRNDVRAGGGYGPRCGVTAAASCGLLSTTVQKMLSWFPVSNT